MNKRALQLTRVLSLKHTIEIMESLESPKDVKTVSGDTGLPAATCYRRINQLKDLGAVKVKTYVESPAGKLIRVYERLVSNWEIGPAEDGEYQLKLDGKRVS